MNKKELISRVAEALREGNIRKPLASNKTVFHITDDCGNKSDFTIYKSEKGALYTVGDVANILNACLAVTERALQEGDEVSIQGFGTLGLNKRAARRTKHPDTGEIINIREHYIPKFNFGNYLRMAAQVYEESLDKESGD